MPLDPKLKKQFMTMANLLRRDSIALTTQAGSGHPTTCLSAADLMAWLFCREIRLDANNLDHPNTDKYIFSKGHVAPLLYALMYRLGYLKAEELSTFRQLGSRLEGHPTLRLPGVIAATGSLGQGLSIAVGLALVYQREQRDQKVYTLMGDGEINEGQVWEAAMAAANLKLDNLVAILDRNKIQQSNFCDSVLNTEPLDDKWRSFGWHAIRLNGHDYDQIAAAFEEARSVKGKPVILIADTEKGQGVSFLQGKLKRHGVALSAAEKEQAFQEIAVDESVDLSDFIVSKQNFAGVEVTKTSVENPLNSSSFDASKTYAAREAYGDALKQMGHHPDIWVVDGDVSNSTFSDRFAQAYPARHVDVGIAEQNMVGVAVGIGRSGKIALANSFARFFERAFDQIEMGVYSQSNFKVVGSHIGISIGEDGTSQMALADCGFMRAIPGAVVLCPSDYVSTFQLTNAILNHPSFCYMRTFRGKQAVLYSTDESFALGDCKVVHTSASPKVMIAANGVCVHEALQAAKQLDAQGIGSLVVDAYSLQPFPADKIQQLCQQFDLKQVVTVEDHYPIGGLGDAVLEALNGTSCRVHKLAVKSFPESGSPQALMAAYGIDAAAIQNQVKKVLQ